MQADPRNIETGFEIPRENYCDQPYVVINEDRSWTCMITTGKGAEGEGGQHIISTISKDQGKTWSDPVDIEPATGPEASFTLPLKTPSGRIYVFYTYNKDNMREVKTVDGGTFSRVDTLGVCAYKYSDDNGRSWSKQRHEVPMRIFEIDRENVYGGKVLFFWGVGKPFIHKGAAYLPVSKVGGFGEGFLTRNEGILLRSDNILTEPDPAKHRWETLPDDDVGLRAPEGPIAGEINCVPMHDGSLYCTYRTIDGYSCHAYSRDDGHTWTAPAYMTYAPGGRKVKNPRAANFVWRCANGKYLYWYHNHGGPKLRKDGFYPYLSRNPVWLSGGTEIDGHIYWSQPEVVLYHPYPGVRMSYPDFIEQDGRYFLTETNKTVARVHEIDPTLLEGMWAQGTAKEVTRNGLVLDEANCRKGSTAKMPPLPTLYDGGGFTLDLWIQFDNLKPHQVILDTRNEEGNGISIMLADRGMLKLTVAGQTFGAVPREMSWDPNGPRCGLAESSWASDPGLLKPKTRHHIAFIVDGGPKIISVVVDGILCDGGGTRQFGWGRFHPQLVYASDADRPAEATLAPSLNGQLKVLRIYNRALRTSEVVGNFHAGCLTPK